LYGGNAPERDATDEVLIEHAIKNNIPLIGICRGMQSILCHFGGTLKTVENHVAVRHKIRGEISREVNSYHGFCAEEIPDRLEMLAIAPDDTIEAVRHKQYQILGIMWHPERENPFQREDKELIIKKLGLEL
jgi:putative glutamine amidotransferase